MFQGMFPSLWWLLPIMLMNPCSRHGFFIWRVRRCLVLPSVVQTFHQGRMTSCIGLIRLIFSSLCDLLACQPNSVNNLHIHGLPCVAQSMLSILSQGGIVVNEIMSGDGL